MKSKNEILEQESVFMNDFTDEIDVLTQFSADRFYYEWNKDKITSFMEGNNNINILFASYGCDAYSGDAWVLFEKDGKLFEVHGGHCSCFGLEGQWEPEEVVLEELEKRLSKGTFGEDNWSDNKFKQELCEFLGIEFKKNINNW